MKYSIQYPDKQIHCRSYQEQEVPVLKSITKITLTLPIKGKVCPNPPHRAAMWVLETFIL